MATSRTVRASGPAWSNDQLSDVTPARLSPTVRRFDAGHAAQRRRDPDRATRVGAEAEQHLARGQRCAGAAAGATGHPSGVPGVAGRGSHDAVRELVGVRLADRHRTGLLEQLHAAGVGRGDEVLAGLRARGGGHAAEVVEVLHAEGDAVQGPPVAPPGDLALHGPRHGESPLAQHGDEHADRGLHHARAVERRVDELHRRQGPGADGVGGRFEADAVQVQIHGAHSQRASKAVAGAARPRRRHGRRRSTPAPARSIGVSATRRPASRSSSA